MRQQISHVFCKIALKKMSRDPDTAMLLRIWETMQLPWISYPGLAGSNNNQTRSFHNRLTLFYHVIFQEMINKEIESTFQFSKISVG